MCVRMIECVCVCVCVCVSMCEFVCAGVCVCVCECVCETGVPVAISCSSRLFMESCNT